MNKRKAIIAVSVTILLGVAILLTKIIYLAFHNSPPVTLSIPDVTKVWQHRHIDTDWKLNNACLNVEITGEVIGEAEFRIQNTRYPIRAGKVHIVETSPEWWSSTVDLGYTPSTVTKGRLQVTVNIR